MVHLKAKTGSCIYRNYDTATLEWDIVDRKKHQQHCAEHQQSWRETKYDHIGCTLQTKKEYYKAKSRVEIYPPTFRCNRFWLGIRYTGTSVCKFLA